MGFKRGHKLHAEIQGIDLTVESLISNEGAQGVIYHVKDSHGRDKALKWYFPDQSTVEQRKALEYLVNQGPPEGSEGKRFIWPEDVVTDPDSRNQFGYLMELIDTNRFSQLGEVQAKLRERPSYSKMCIISYRLANSFRSLHLSGHCYRDVSKNNYMFDSKTGDVVIFDNDNVGVNNQSIAQVLGTWENMAPEIVMGTANPSTETDRHSLAVAIFEIWTWHHPMHGEMEYNIRVWDANAKIKIYGKNPVFVFDPDNPSNRLPPGDYHTARQMWQQCPQLLKSLFTKAFTTGLHSPNERVTEGEWRRVFLQLYDGCIACPRDGAENIWENGLTDFRCWHCGEQIHLPRKLALNHPTGTYHVLLNPGRKILRRHVDADVSEADGVRKLGEVIENPNKKGKYGIQNRSQQTWTIFKKDGETINISPGESAGLKVGNKITIMGTSGIIEA